MEIIVGIIFVMIIVMFSGGNSPSKDDIKRRNRYDNH